MDQNIIAKPIDIKKEIAKMQKMAKRDEGRAATYFNVDKGAVQSSFFDPYTYAENIYGNLKTFDRRLNRSIDCQTLRRVSQKAWIINLCIGNVQKKIVPFLKQSNDLNNRGFIIKKKGEAVSKAIGNQQQKDKLVVKDFILNTGSEYSSDRDSFVIFCKKIIRDLLEIDQVATEIAYTKGGDPYGFYAIDGGTIEKVQPNQNNPYNIKYIQLIDDIPQAFYPEGKLIFDYQNPRTDINYSSYGYSVVEQAVDLITGAINAFTYNTSFFTDNKLPKGMLLLDGNASQETVEAIEDYIYDIMSGQTGNQWKIPIIPSGGSGSDNNSIKWVSLNGSNRDMEFQQWLDFVISSVVALFGCSVDELGIQLSKSQPIVERNTSPEIEASKSLILGDTLTWLQTYLNKILILAYPDYELEFVGYERDDPKMALDLIKGELDSYKTLNEVRKDKGLKPIDQKWADECPANPQLVQMYQSAQQQEMMGDGGMDDFEDEEGGDGETDNTDNEAWGDVEGDNEPTTDDNEQSDENTPEDTENSTEGDFSSIATADETIGKSIKRYYI